MGEMTLKNMFKIILYVLFSSFGLVLLKMGTKGLEISLHKGNFTLSINYILIIGMIFYVLSFLTSLITMKGMNLNVFYPISAGLVYIMVCILSYFILHEKMTLIQIIGICITLIGIVVMNIKKG